MTRAEMITSILEDMYRFRSKAEVDKRWKGFLNRQNKPELAKIYKNRLESKKSEPASPLIAKVPAREA